MHLHLGMLHQLSHAYLDSFTHSLPTLTLLPHVPLHLLVLQPEQIRQCLVDYASINVWQLQGAESEAPSIVLAAA